MKILKEKLKEKLEEKNALAKTVRDFQSTSTEVNLICRYYTIFISQMWEAYYFFFAKTDRGVFSVGAYFRKHTVSAFIV